MRWVAAGAAEVRVVRLDVLTAVYHRASGITHLLDAPAPELLAALAEPADVDELIARLSVDYDLGDDARGGLAARLAELADAGLVRAA